MEARFEDPTFAKRIYPEVVRRFINFGVSYLKLFESNTLTYAMQDDYVLLFCDLTSRVYQDSR